MSIFLKDLLERAGRTFVQAFASSFAVTFAIPADFADLNAWKSAALAAGIAGIAAGLSAVMSLIGKNRGTPGTASLVKLEQAPTIVPGGVSPFVQP